jgi:hypothetical protein
MIPERFQNRFLDLVSQILVIDTTAQVKFTGTLLAPDVSFTSSPLSTASINAVIAAFDWSPRRPRAISNLAADITALSASDRNKLQIAIAAKFLQDNPRFARALSIAVDGDEVAP